MKNPLLLLSLLAVIFSWSCQSDTDSTKKAASNQATEVFRGIDFSMTPAQIKKAEKGTFSKEKSGKLFYSDELNGNDFADITYEFAGNKLNIIRYDAYLSSPAAARRLHAKLKKEFDAKHTLKKGLWMGKSGDIYYSVFLKLLESKKNPGVAVVWERI